MFLKLLLVGLGIAAADIFGPGGWLGLEDCWDRESLKYCNDAKANGYCTRPDKWRDMRIKCEQTCKLCGQPTPVPITVSTIWCSDDCEWEMTCVDNESKAFCRNAFEKGFCKNPEKEHEMRLKCARKCGLCTKPTTPQTYPPSTSSSHGISICEDNEGAAFCDDAFKKGYCKVPEMQREMKQKCAKTCDLCTAPTPAPQTYHPPSTTPSLGKPICEDNEGAAFCDDAFKKGYCKVPEMQREMKQKCAKTCDLCTAPTPAPQTHHPPSTTPSLGKPTTTLFPFWYPSCWDRESLKYCNDAKANGYCTRPDKWRDMRLKCEQTCDLCGQPTPVPITVPTVKCPEPDDFWNCLDRESRKFCNDAYAKGYCTRRDKWYEMRIKCEETCGLCNDPKPSPRIGYDTTPTKPRPICTNTKGEKYCDDAYAKGYCERADKWREMRMGCAAKCDFCNDPSPPPLSYDHSSTTHEDRHEKVCEDKGGTAFCDKSFVFGYCKMPEKRAEMKTKCARKCGFCEESTTQPSSSTSKTGEKMEFTTPPSPRTTKAQEKVESTTPPSPSTTKAEEKIESTTPPSPITTKAEEKIESTTPPSPSTTKAEEKVESTTPPSPSTTKAEEKVESTTLPSPSTTKAEEKVESTTSPGPSTTKAGEKICKNEKPSTHCRELLESGHCEDPMMITIVKEDCAKTCGLCPAPTETTVCEDMASEYKCKRWQQSGYCSSQELYPVMKEFCEKTCELCGGGQGIGNRSISTTGKGEGELTTSLPVLRNRTEVCKNKQSNTHCREVFESGQCDDTFMYVIVKEDCPKTCGLCPSTSGDEACRDRISETRCNKWKSAGYCHSEKDFLLMKESCEKTCGFCTSTGTFGNGSSSVVKGESSSSTHLPTSGADPISVSTEEGHLTTHSPSPGNETKEVCANHLSTVHCREVRESGQCDDLTMYVIVKEDCPKECGLCPNKADTEVCRDKISEKRCKKWRELGYCSSKKDFLLMKESCKKTCGFCERPGPSGYLPGEDTTNKPSTRKPRKGDCYDKKDSNYCETALQSGKCDDVAAFTEMSKECAMTCDLCLSPKKPSVCKDRASKQKCKKWMLAGHCRSRKAYSLMKNVCEATCELCDNEKQVCKDQKGDLYCRAVAGSGVCDDVLMYAIVREDCPEKCGICLSNHDYTECKDRISEEKCKKWKRAGHCAKKRYHSVLKEACEKTCNLCLPAPK